ncbi:MAG TPA: hypothetical protein VMH49_06260 [Thermoplasmata archaeon]|nr:hypothetical protein [Thermoplasmata archaeon]
MPDTSDQAEFRRHLNELRRAAGGLGHDFASEITQLDRKIEQLGTTTARDTRELVLDIEDDLAGLGRSVDEELRRLPHALAEAGTAIGSGTARAAGAAKDAVVVAGKKAKEGTKNAFAAAAGVRRTPMRSWTPPAGAEGGSGDEASR